MASNTTYDPINDTYYDKTKMKVSRKTVRDSVTAGQTKNIDYTLTDDMLFDGARVLVKNGDFDDSMSLQIVHPTYGVLEEFVSGEPIASDQEEQLNFTNKYPAKIPAGLIIRLVFVSSGIVVTRKVAIGLSLHKVME